MSKIRTFLAAAAFAMAPFAASASTIPIAPVGSTTVEVQQATLAALGLGGAPTGSASVTDLGTSFLFSFPITGGSIHEDGNALIEHEGSGLQLFATADPTVSATVENFLVDTTEAAVFGDVVGGTADLRLFNFGTIDEDGIGLNITPIFAFALSQTFGAPFGALNGAEFGVANTSPQPIPLPAGLPLLAVGLGLFAVIRRRAA